MEDRMKYTFRNELSNSGITNSKISALESELSKFGFNADKLVEDIMLYGRNLEKQNRNLFYEKAVNVICNYYYPDTVLYLSKKIFSLDEEKVMDTLEVLGKDYLSAYVNFIDLSYKHSKGIDLVDKLFSLDKINDSTVKELIKKDIEMKDIKELVPKEVFSSLY
jgi:hypothetical protein